MAITVRTNLAALRATTQLGSTQNNLTASLERISSGLRINRAADDAAGLSVASRMTSDNTSLTQAMRNINDGISLIQTAEGGLNEIYNMLVRLRELAVQGGNETYSSADRAQINTEFTQITSEIDRIAATNNFNRVNLLNQSNNQLTFQIGIQTSANDVLNVQLSNFAATVGGIGLNTSNIGASGISTLARATQAISLLDAAINDLNTKRAKLGALQNRLENSLNEAANYSENLAAAASQILDVDYASESANMTRYQIMQQAGVAALGQAKAIPQSVISLLS
jgi:flagellin